MAYVQDMGRDRKKNRWKARYRAPDGKERARSFDKRIEAEAWISTQTADVARGQWVDPQLGTITFAAWVKQWEKGLTNLRPTTRALNLGVVHNHLLPRFGRFPLARITAAHVKEMVAAGGGSNSAIRRRVIVLRTILKAAVEEGRIGRNPAAGIVLPPEDTRTMQFLEPGQIAALADAFQPHYRPLVFTAAYVGLRWGELAGLRVENVDPLRQTIKVVEQLVEVSGRVSWGPPKTKAGRRTVTMPATIAEMLGFHMGSGAVQESGLVFPTIQGRPMKRSNFRKLWGRAVSAVDIPEGFHFHELRHTAAALSIAQGAHPLTIKERLGHSSIVVTMDRYGHLFPGQDKALAEGLDGVLRDSLAQGVSDARG
jgi:integrase